MKPVYDLCNQYLRQTFKLPEGWRAYEWSCAPEDAPQGHTRYVGAVCPNKADGHANWKKKDKATIRTVFMVQADFTRWQTEEAARLGVCPECWGTGTLWSGWSADTGHKTKPCNCVEVKP
jgi:hypothetical protein